MKPIDYQILIENINIYKKEICRVFEKLREEEIIAGTKILSYGYFSSFERVEWVLSDETNVSVRYYNYCYEYDSDIIEIPVRILFNDEEIDKWIRDIISDELISIKEL